MESANLQQLQDLQLVGSSSSSSLDNTDASCYGASTAHPWSPSVSLNNVSFSQNYNNEMLNTRDLSNSESVSLSHMHNHSLIQQDLALQWHHQSPYDHHHHHQGLLKIKEELSSSTSNQPDIPKFTDMLNSSVVTNYLKINEHKDLNDLTEKLLLKTISSGFPINGEYCSYSSSSASSSPSSSSSTSVPSSHRGSFSQIYPSINISSLSQSPRMNIPRPFDMNLQALEGALFSGSSLVHPNSQDVHLGMYRGSLPFGLADHQLHQSIHHPSSSPTDQVQHFSNDPQASEGKRPNMLAETKGGENAAKKPRVESRASCPPLKVRKEKLGDRIAALQQLVSPFGKTDTASVLMEAIGYIKFLQNQIETLSVPYMRASRNRTGKTSQGGSISNDGNEEQKRDLRSRGLCLVPLSCMSYVTGDGGSGGGVGGGFWPAPPGFGGGA